MIDRAKNGQTRRGALLSLLCVCLALPWALCGCAPQARLSAPPDSPALTRAAQGLDAYDIYAVFDPQARTLACTQRVRYRNRGQEALPALYLRAYPAAFRSEETSPAAIPEHMAATYGQAGFDAGDISFAAVAVDGAAAPFVRSGEDGTALRVTLTAPLAPGDWAALDLTYTLQIPRVAYRFGVAGETWCLGNAFPLVAARRENAWALDAYEPIGDPFLSDCANFTFTLDAPAAFVPAATGALRSQTGGDDRTLWQWQALAARDFALVLFARCRTAQRLLAPDGPLVVAHAASENTAQAMLTTAEAALRLYGRLFGTPYPYPVFTLAQASLGGYGGMEYPGLVFIEAADLAGENLAYVVAHETAHQWWYALVGSDQVLSPWLDEALAEYAALLYVENTQGSEAFEALYQRRIEPALRLTFPAGVTVGAPLDRFASVAEYGMVVYQRGAGMLHGLRLAMGDEAFFAALGAYARPHTFGMATPEDFLFALAAASGANWAGYIADF
ncbi:MAG: M1 family metallopeptidase [Oscillospiraceae bacterium]|jgi:aminopeptidase N|nr:M1 family metallopeptidase [Oscillospiraceae bacterium]